MTNKKHDEHGFAAHAHGYPDERFRDTMGTWSCTECGRDDTVLDQDGERYCASGWCEDSAWPCEECGELGCECGTERCFVGQAIAAACRNNGLLWGQELQRYMKQRGIDREWKVGLRDLCDLLLHVVQGDRS